MNKAIALTATLLATITLGAATANTSNSMRCSGRLVYAGGADGSHMHEVLRKCGQPTAKLSNFWIYERQGKRSVLEFDHRGRLYRIENERL